MDKTGVLAQNVTTRMNTMLMAVDSQTAAISQITEGINQISAVAQSTSDTSEQGAATAQKLSSQSLLMNKLVRKFRLN